MDKCRERMKAAIDKYGYTYEQLEGLTGVVVRVNDKANALLEDVSKRSKKSKSYVASKMIEYAYEFVEYLEGGE